MLGCPVVACAWHALAPGAPAIPEALVTRGSSDKILARLLAQAALLHSTWLTHVDAVTGASEPRRALQHLLGACRAMDRVTQSGDPLLDGRLGDDDLGIDWEADWGHVAARELADDMRSSQEAWEFPSDCDTCARLASGGIVRRGHSDHAGCARGSPGQAAGSQDRYPRQYMHPSS